MSQDNVKEIEKLIEQAEEDAKAIMSESVDKFAPHAIGTAKVARKDLKFDYDNRGPDYWPTMASRAMADVASKGGNVGDALIALLKHDKDLRDGSTE